MDSIEPHWISTLWFAAFATICTVAFLVIAGMFPLQSLSESPQSGARPHLVIGNAVLLLVLLTGTGVYGYAELRSSTLIVVAGLAILFAPGLFEIWPSSFRDGRKGLVVLVGVQILALVILANIVKPCWANLS